MGASGREISITLAGSGCIGGSSGSDGDSGSMAMSIERGFLSKKVFSFPYPVPVDLAPTQPLLLDGRLEDVVAMAATAVGEIGRREVPAVHVVEDVDGLYSITHLA